MTTNESEMVRLYQQLPQTDTRKKAVIYQKVLLTLLETYNPHKFTTEYKPNVISRKIVISILNVLERNEWREYEEFFVGVVCSFIKNKMFSFDGVFSFSGVLDIESLIETSEEAVTNALRVQEKITFNGDIWSYGEIPKPTSEKHQKVSSFNRGSGR